MKKSAHPRNKESATRSVLRTPPPTLHVCKIWRKLRIKHRHSLVVNANNSFSAGNSLYMHSGEGCLTGEGWSRPACSPFSYLLLSNFTAKLLSWPPTPLCVWRIMNCRECPRINPCFKELCTIPAQMTKCQPYMWCMSHRSLVILGDTKCWVPYIHAVQGVHDTERACDVSRNQMLRVRYVLWEFSAKCFGASWKWKSERKLQ